MKTAMVPREQFSLAPTNMAEAMEYSNLIAQSNFCPKDMKNKPGDVLVAVQMGAEVGLQPLNAIQNIAVINGRPSIWGDALLAIVQASSVYESIDETLSEDGKTAFCKVKRVGEGAQTRTFCMDDARCAGLLNKQGPWKQYPRRMLQMRARGFALRDVFADVIKGLVTREEAQDNPIERDVTETVAEPVTSTETTQLTGVELAKQRARERKSRQEEVIADQVPDADIMSADDIQQRFMDSKTIQELKAAHGEFAEEIPQLAEEDQNTLRDSYGVKLNELKKSAN